MNDLALTGGRTVRAVRSTLYAVTVRFWRWLARCHSRSTQRGALADLDPRLLRDIGISEAERMMESDRPFWR